MRLIVPSHGYLSECAKKSQFIGGYLAVPVKDGLDAIDASLPGIAVECE